MTHGRTQLPALELDSVSKTYGSANTAAVREISFSIKKGELFCLIGPNGSGKSTVLKMAAGLLAPDNGSVRISGVDGGKDPMKAKKSVGYAAEEPVFYENMTGKKFLRFLADMHCLGEKARTAGLAMCRDFGLEDLLDSTVVRYPWAMRQKLSLVSAFLPEPEILVFDEPFPGLDPGSIRVFREILSQRMKRGAAVLLSTYMMHVAEGLLNGSSGRLGVMREGMLVENSSLRLLKKKHNKPRASLEELYLELFQ